MKTAVTKKKDLRDSEIRYRRLFEAAQDGILILDAQTGMIEDVNPFLIDMLGYSREEFVKKKLWEVGAFKDIEASKDAFEALQKNEYIRYEDLPLKTKDGRLIEVAFVSNVYLVGGEKVIQCNIRENTEHKLLIAALRENEKKYHDLLNNSPDGYFIIELSGNIFCVNEAICKELEFSEEELLSMSVWDIVPEQYLEQYRERLTKALKGESLKESVEYMVRGKNGRAHYVEVLSAPRYSGGDIIGFQGIARDITARKRAEEALRESEHRFKMAFWATKDVIWERNIPANTILWNESMQKLFHYKVGEIEPTVDWWQEHIHPAERAKVMESIQTVVVQRGDFWSQEYRFRLADGSYADVFDRGYILYDGQGQPLQFVGAMVDVTKQKQSEKALQSSEDKYRTLVNEVNDGLYVTDNAGIFTFANFALAQMYGVETPQALVGRMFSDFIAPEMPEDTGEAYQSAMETGRSLEVVNGQIVQPDGTRVFIEIKPVMIIEGGQGVGTRGVVRDISERKRAEKALRSSEEKYRTLITHLPTVVYTNSLDDASATLYVSPQIERLLGYTPQEWLADPELWSKTLHPEDRAEVLMQIALADQSEKAFEMDYRMTARDGSLVWVHDQLTLVTDLEGKPQYWQGIMLDITERKRGQERIQRQLEHLTATSAIDRSIASSFDLKLTLSQILGHVTKELGVDAADILILDPVMQMLEYAAGRGFRTAAAKTAQVPLGKSYAGRVALERRLVQIPNLDDDPNNLLLTTLLAGEDFICYFGVPLITKGQVKGVLETFHRTTLEPDTEWFDFLNALAGQAAIAIENFTLFDGLQRMNSELVLAYETTLEGWSRALDLRDKETEGHTQRVTEMAVELARAFGLSEAGLLNVRRGGLLHDIGKMGVPDHILLKPGELTREEWRLMRMHPVYAYDLLSHIAYLRDALDIPYCHHEKWDGSGYPRGLKGDQIPLTARIFAVVDVWDAITSDRPYRAAWTKPEALKYIQASSGTHFDPEVVNQFLAVIGMRFVVS